MVAGSGKGVVDQGCGIKDEMGRMGKNADFGSRNGRRSSPRSVAEWSAEPGVEASKIRRDLRWGHAALSSVVSRVAWGPCRSAW